MTRLRHLNGALIVALLATTGACSFVIDTNATQCVEDKDCDALSPGATCDENNLCTPDPTFACRGTPFAEPAGAPLDFSLSVVNLVGQTPYEGLTVQACPNLDTECASPVGDAVTDAAGSFTISLEEGFRGHLFVPPPAEDPMLAPLKAHIFPPPSSDPSVPVRGGLVVTNLQFVGGLAMLAGRTLEPGTGQIFFTAIDCQGDVLEGVTVSAASSTPETLVAYLGASGQPDLALAGTGSTGQGAIINVPTGFVTIRGIHANEGLIFEQSVIVAPDTITSVPIVPSPTQ